MTSVTWWVSAFSALALGLTACGGESNTSGSETTTASPPASPTTPLPTVSPTQDASVALKDAVTAYSTAYLGGDGPQAYALLSARCKARVSAEQMQSMTRSANATYGQQPIQTLVVDDQSGDLARVTYTYTVPAINQTREPWVRESGQWLEDDC